MEESYREFSQHCPTSFAPNSSFGGPYASHRSTHYYPSSPGLRSTIPPHPIAQPYQTQASPQYNFPVLIQYKRHGSGALIGVAVLYISDSASFPIFIQLAKRLASSDLFNIQNDAKDEEIVFRSVFVRWSLGQALDENRYDSPIRDDEELERVLNMMAKRGWIDHFVVFYDVVMEMRRDTAESGITSTDGMETPRTT